MDDKDATIERLRAELAAAANALQFAAQNFLAVGIIRSGNELFVRTNIDRCATAAKRAREAAGG